MIKNRILIFKSLVLYPYYILSNQLFLRTENADNNISDSFQRALILLTHFYVLDDFPKQFLINEIIKCIKKKCLDNDTIIQI